MLHQNSAKFACTSTYLKPRTHFFWPDWKTTSLMLGGAKRKIPADIRWFNGTKYLFLSIFIFPANGAGQEMGNFWGDR